MSLCGFNTWPSLEKVDCHSAAVTSCVWCFHGNPVMLWVPVLLMTTWIVAPGHCCIVLSLLPALCLLSVDMLFTVVGHVYCLLTCCLLLWTVFTLCWHAVYCCGPCLLCVDMLFITVCCVVCWHAVYCCGPCLLSVYYCGPCRLSVYCCGPCLLSVDMLFVVVDCVYCLFTCCLFLWTVSTVCWHYVYSCGLRLLSVDMLFIVVDFIDCFLFVLFIVVDCVSCLLMCCVYQSGWCLFLQF